MDELDMTDEISEDTIEVDSEKQSVGGFKVKQYLVKKTKDAEMVTITLEAFADEVRAGKFDFGDVLQALWSHQAGDYEVCLNVFIKKK